MHFRLDMKTATKRTVETTENHWSDWDTENQMKSTFVVNKEIDWWSFRADTGEQKDSREDIYRDSIFPMNLSSPHFIFCWAPIRCLWITPISIIFALSPETKLKLAWDSVNAEQNRSDPTSVSQSTDECWRNFKGQCIFVSTTTRSLLQGGYLRIYQSCLKGFYMNILKS